MSSLIGLEPNQLVVNGLLGGMAYQDPEAVNIGAGNIGSLSVDQINTHVGAGGAAHALATPSSAGFMSAADKTKLDGLSVSSGIRYGVDNGTANVYTVTFDVPITALTDGLVVQFKAGNANTGASTFNPDGLGAKPIVTNTGAAISSGTILANGDVWLQYNTSFAAGSWVALLNADVVSFSELINKPTTLNGYGITDAQPLASNLTSLAGLTGEADTLIYFTGANSTAISSLTSFARTLLGSADATTARTTLGANNAGNLNAGTIPAARLPAYTGDVTSAVGSAALTLSNSGVTPGTYTSVTVDAKGRVTSGANIGANTAYVSVSDYGAVGDGVTDDSAAIQSAINYAQSVDKTVMLSPGKKYKVNTGLTFKHGKNATDTKTYHARLIGNNSTIFPGVGVTAVTIAPRCTLAHSGTGRGEADIKIEGVYFDGYFDPVGARAILIGNYGMWCSNIAWSCIRDVLVSGFNNDLSVCIRESRQIVIENCSCKWTSGFTIEAITTNSFCGDMMFYGCQFEGNGDTVKPLHIHAGGSNAATRGIHFVSCDIYQSGTRIISDMGGDCGDIWFMGCQFDQATGNVPHLQVYVKDTSKLVHLHIKDTYFVGSTNGAIQFDDSSSYGMYNVDVSGCTFGEIKCTNTYGDSVIYATGCKSLNISNCRFDHSYPQSIINAHMATNVQIHHNTATRNMGSLYGISVGGTGMDKYSVLGNMMNVTTAVVNDYTTGTPTKLVANNLLV